MTIKIMICSNSHFDVDDETKPAYYIQFDTSSVVINDNDSQIHNGSVKIAK